MQQISSESLMAAEKSGKICGLKTKRLWGIACSLRTCFLLSKKKGLEGARIHSLGRRQALDDLWSKASQDNCPHTPETVTAGRNGPHPNEYVCRGWGWKLLNRRSGTDQSQEPRRDQWSYNRQKEEHGVICGGRDGKEGWISFNTKDPEKKMRITVTEEDTERRAYGDMRLER